MNKEQWRQDETAESTNLWNESGTFRPCEAYIKLTRFWGSHSSAAAGSIVVECDAVYFGRRRFEWYSSYFLNYINSDQSNGAQESDIQRRRWQNLRHKNMSVYQSRDRLTAQYLSVTWYLCVYLTLKFFWTTSVPTVIFLTQENQYFDVLPTTSRLLQWLLSPRVFFFDQQRISPYRYQHFNTN